MGLLITGTTGEYQWDVNGTQVEIEHRRRMGPGRGPPSSLASHRRRVPLGDTDLSEYALDSSSASDSPMRSCGRPGLSCAPLWNQPCALEVGSSYHVMDDIAPSCDIHRIGETGAEIGPISSPARRERSIPSMSIRLVQSSTGGTCAPTVLVHCTTPMGPTSTRSRNFGCLRGVHDP